MFSKFEKLQIFCKNWDILFLKDNDTRELRNARLLKKYLFYIDIVKSNILYATIKIFLFYNIFLEQFSAYILSFPCYIHYRYLKIASLEWSCHCSMTTLIGSFYLDVYG